MGVKVTNVNPVAGVSVSRPRASVVVTEPVADISFELLAISAQASVAGAVVTAVIPVSRLSYVALSASASLDTTGRFKYVVESASVSDKASVDSLKFPVSPVEAGDSATLAVDAFQSHSVFLVEDFQRLLTFVRSFSSEYGATDAQEIIVAKALAHNFSTSDGQVLEVLKSLSSGVAMNDLADLQDGITYQTVKSVMNAVFSEDVLGMSLSRPISDLAPVQDTPSLTPTLPKFNSVEANDAASLEPAKGVAESIEFVDAVLAAVDKVLAHSVDLAEQIVAEYSKAASSSAAAEDAQQKSFATSRSHAVEASDFTALEQQKLAASAIDAFDAALMDVAKAAASNATPLDFAILGVSLGLSHSVSQQESVLYGISKLLQSGAAINDSAESLDGLLFFSTKSVSNIVLASDARTLATTLGRSHSAPVTDTGRLVSQGYCDLTYFADDYVGATRDF